MKKQYIISIDQSTQGTKAMLFDEQIALVGSAVIPHRQIVNEQGWVEHDAAEIAENLITVTEELLIQTGIDRTLVVGVGIANQRETVAIWDRESGTPLHHAIVWQCNRATEICEEFEAAGHAGFLERTTGLKLSPFFSGPKLAWLLRHVPGAMDKALDGTLCCGTMDSWAIFHLTGQHKTDVSNASRMMLMNLESLNWDKQVCQILGIPSSCLPEICDSDAYFGQTDFNGLLPNPVPVHAAIGDSHAVLYAHGCKEKGTCMTGFGTGSCVMMNLGDRPLRSQSGLLTSVAWRIKGNLRYAFDGVINYSGAVITWLVKDLQLVDTPAQTSDAAKQANAHDSTCLVPAFTGIGAPHWSNTSNAVFWRMSRNTGKNELIKAALESVAFQVADVVTAMEQDADTKVQSMRVAGGPTKNDYLMQFQSDILNIPIFIPDNEEMTCLGAALIAGEALGIYSLEQTLRDQGKTYQPKMNAEKRNERITQWKRAVRVSIEG